jgi:hypothetical protein
MSINRFGDSFRIISIFLLSALGVSAQDHSTGLISGTAVDENGSPVQGALVNASSVAVPGIMQHTLIRYVLTDAAGRFSIDRLDWGKYELFTKKEGSAYPNTSFSFYFSGSIPEVTITPRSPTADVQIRLGPKAGILTGSVTNAETGAPVNAGFKLVRVSPANNWFSTSQASNYRVLLPSSTDVRVEVSAPGYKTWASSGPLRLQSGEEMRLDISLEVSRDPNLPASEFLVPDGYVGWLRLECNVKDAPPATVENNGRVFKFPKNGVLTTSSSVPEEGTEKRYLYFTEKDSTRNIATDYRHGHGMVWGETQGTRGGMLSQFYFFVGTEEQYKEQGHRGLQGDTPALF